jgi:hypothetical protein
MGCACNKNRGTASAVAAAVAGTYRVYVNGRKVYETTSSSAANTLMGKYAPGVATIYAPGETP